jgi:hypothetical protein
MVKKLEKFWTPINVVLWITILANLGTGIFVLVNYFSTFVWIEAFFNVLIAVFLLIWLSSLYEVLHFDTTMAENYSANQYGSRYLSKEAVAAAETTVIAKKESKPNKAGMENVIDSWTPIAGFDRPRQDPYGYIEALIKGGFVDEADRCLQQAAEFDLFDSTTYGMLLSDLNKKKNQQK